MDKDLWEHKEYVAEMASKLESLEKSSIDMREQAKDLYVFHTNRVKDFQHERLIHLIVTLFFATLFLLSMYVLLKSTSLQYSFHHVSLLMVLAGSLTGILFLVELFYIRHYYKLENGTQDLYKLTIRISKLL
jgi:hypothetical protein